MSFLLGVLGIIGGLLLVMVNDPTQLVPRYFHPIRHSSVHRTYERWRAEFPIKRPFYLLMLVSGLLMTVLFLVSMIAEVPNEILLLRLALGVGVGAYTGWRIMRRQEIIFTPFGIVGLYPNPRLVVAWGGLSGYAVQSETERIVLVDTAGDPVEAWPVRDDVERRSMELAMMPYLNRIEWNELKPAGPQGKSKHLVTIAGALLGLGMLPLAVQTVLRIAGMHSPDILLTIAITLGVLVPFSILDWSIRFRLVHFTGKGHVKLAELTMRCQGCFYHPVCWESGLQRRVRWQPGRRAVVPSWHEFRGSYVQTPELTEPIYNTCCQCLIAHLSEQDIYLVTLHELPGRKKPATESFKGKE